MIDKEQEQSERKEMLHYAKISARTDSYLDLL